MRIHVKAEGRRINLILPTGLMLNRLTAQIISAKTKDDAELEIQLSGEQLNQLFRIIRRVKKVHPDWTLVEVRTHGGEEVTIKL